ncbi:MAG: hypothetical protein GTO45_37235 [Candidatus Aminicenantes bacterium]|nr:hypothetical protein [Candidatus Aminicenantes bacterium]NIM84311.1 hypothetical protein [Candidatus Aminicenantes bacterium]NIN23797.1 hypothetical protein [Candidatus Aminicenantes bacterium]NIN47513.1 hypothetical protein [Candidatus Aminicenantes bacterium]NIN90433.1 hypothetical protein [Candidatus Aminicenantes bacterium]
MRKRTLTHTVTWVTLPLAACLLVGFSFALPGSEDNAPGTGNLKGFIFKANGKTPLWGAQVVLKNVKTGQKFESNVTDSVGDYKLLDIPEGDYQVKIFVKDKNYEVKTVDFLIKIRDGKTTTISFSLKKFRKFLIFGIPLCKITAFIAALATIGVLIL